VAAVPTSITLSGVSAWPDRVFALDLDVLDTDWPALELLLDELGALAVTQSEGDCALFNEPGFATDAQWGRFKVEALFASSSAADTAARAIRSAPGAGEVALRTIDDESWAERWKVGWAPLQFAGGLCVCPSWCEPPDSARHVIRLDPGQAFGTGTHTSTALCLDWLVGCAPFHNEALIDYGCGSGILALAAATLGARHITAVDIDEHARDIAAENIRLNKAEKAIAVAHPGDIAGISADVLVANILLAPLLRLELEFASLLAPGARIALAGVLQTQVDEVRECYAPNFMFGPAVERDEWALLSGRRR